MPDREKVIHAIERCTCHVPDACRDCGYDAGHPYNECVELLLKDALELLKGQEAEKEKYLWECPECGSQLILKTSKISKAIGLDLGECPVCGKEARYGKG
jgi:ssDNA-binding Zn-finger/Zn-ribbon topoisomerase 1